MLKTIRPALLALLAFLAGGLASPAAAQIYSWRDAKGVLHLSDRHPGGGTAVVQRKDVLVSPASRGRASAPFEAMMARAAEEHGVRLDLVRAVIEVESGFNPNAVSPKGAMGLMQLMPGTAADLGVTNPFDPEQNIRGGVTYLRQLLDLYDNDETLALAAYNAGPETVARYGNQVPPYRETRSYVERIKGRPDAAPTAGRVVFYKTIEIIDGRPVPRYSTEKPRNGPYEIIDIRR